MASVNALNEQLEHVRTIFLWGRHQTLVAAVHKLKELQEEYNKLHPENQIRVGLTEQILTPPFKYTEPSCTPLVN